MAATDIDLQALMQEFWSGQSGVSIGAHARKLFGQCSLLEVLVLSTLLGNSRTAALGATCTRVVVSAENAGVVWKRQKLLCRLIKIGD